MKLESMFSVLKTDMEIGVLSNASVEILREELLGKEDILPVQEIVAGN